VDDWQLFDLKTDPHELRNVLDLPENKDTVSSLKKEIIRLRTELKVPETEDPSAFGKGPTPKAIK
jgi:hypothetical protein